MNGDAAATEECVGHTAPVRHEGALTVASRARAVGRTGGAEQVLAEWEDRTAEAEEYPDGTRQRRRSRQTPPNGAPSINVTVVNERKVPWGRGGSEDDAKPCTGARRVMEQGSVFTDCLHCTQPILWHPNPDKAVKPYQACSNRCHGERPKAIHVSCIPAFCSLPENDNEQLTAKCEACDNSFDLDQIASVRILLVAFLTSRFLRVSLVFLALFFLSGFAWKTWNYVYVANGWEPVDLINNPALMGYNTSTNETYVLRPEWSWTNWTGWARYNHCVLTEWGRRRLLSDFDRHRRALSGGYRPPETHELSMAEAYTKLYSFMLDTSDETFVDMSHYFSPCSDTGTIGFTWRWLFSHIAISIHALRWYLGIGLIVSVLVTIDAALGWTVYRVLMRKSTLFRVSQGGQTFVVRKARTVAGARRRII